MFLLLAHYCSRQLDTRSGVTDMTHEWVLIIALLSHDSRGYLTHTQAVMTATGIMSERACYDTGREWLKHNGYTFGDGSSRISCAPTDFKKSK